MADAKPPSRDFDDLDDKGILDLFDKVKSAWSTRDEAIRCAVELRDEKWNCPVPKNWRKTATQHRSSRAKEIPQRLVGTLMLNQPTYHRPNPGEDFQMGSDQNQVERFHQAYFNYWDRSALKGRSGHEAILDNLVGKGAVCAGSLLAPHMWASAPLFMDGDSVRREHWRDSSGRETDSLDAMDQEASTRAYEKSVDQYRQRASSGKPQAFPLKRRILAPEQTFPLIVEDELLGLFIERKSSLIELELGGYAIELPASGGSSTGRDFVEFITPNRCRYYLNERPIKHGSANSEEGLVTNYGFVPYVYQSSLSAGETEYGSWGMPVLGLVDSNLRTIQTLRTYLMNAVHLASFTSFYIKYLGTTDERAVAAMIDGKTGKQLTTFEFKSGTIMDFGPNREVVALTHPGLNADFWKALAAEEQDVDRIIPRSLTGEATSSGYNTALSSVQARALFNSLYHADELLLEQLGQHDMRHIEKLPGPVYLEWEKPTASKAKKYLRVRLDKDLIGGYYGLRATIERTLDPITEGEFRANMRAQGVGDVEWVAEGAGIPDYEDMLARRARDRVFESPVTQAALDERAVKRFKLKNAVAEAAAAGRIQMAPDGTPMVATKDGRVVGPGVGVQTPQGQGFAGAQGGRTNNMAPQSNGGPNMASTNNPSIATPSPTPTGRSRMRRRGGAIPGAPQHHAAPPTPHHPAV